MTLLAPQGPAFGMESKRESINEPAASRRRRLPTEVQRIPNSSSFLSVLSLLKHNHPVKSWSNEMIAFEYMCPLTCDTELGKQPQEGTRRQVGRLRNK